MDWLEALVPTGTEAAGKNYGAHGWTVHHCSDIFGYILMEAPPYSACPGTLVTNPSISPENEYRLADGTTGMLTYGAAMDTEIILDLFDNFKECADAIRLESPDFDEALYQAVASAGRRLPEIKVSPSHGGIQEWIEDYAEADPGHRHVSQLYGVYPGRSIQPDTPLAAAARRTIERKYEAGYDGQGWSLGWIAAICARLGDGDKGYEAVCEIYRRHILPNLMINAHGFPQVGDAMGSPAAIMEMLVQSHGPEIALLPALPAALPDGHVRGLHLRGGDVLDMVWENGRLREARLTHRSGFPQKPVRVAAPGDYEITGDDTNLFIKPCEA